MNNTLVKLIGWPATILQRDPSVFDRWLWLRRHLGRGPQRTLDAGCGSGELTLYAAKVGNQAVGLSFDERLNDIARTRAQLLHIPNAEFITVDLRTLAEISGRIGVFDQIMCFETIEHILNDTKLIADLSRLLKPQGRLLLTTPFKHRKRQPGEGLSEHEDGGHVRWGYTHQELRTLLNSAGLEVQIEDYLTGLVSQQIIMLMRRWGDSRTAWALTLPLRLFRAIDPLLTRVLNYPYLCIAVVAVKHWR
jgi:SAM-dependent methyltransferase